MRGVKLRGTRPSSVILHGVTERRRLRIFDVLSRRQPDLTVLAEDVYKPHNLSAVLRSCDAVGIGTVHAVKPTGGVPTYSATSASAEKWVEVLVHGDVSGAVAAVRRWGARVYAAHLSPAAVDYREVDYTVPCALRSEEHTSELQSRPHLVCRLLLEKKKRRTMAGRNRA